MKRREKLMQKPIPRHIAVIMDGNGRWAKRRGRERSYGHRMGALNIKTITLEAHRLGVEAFSIYAFSTENWKRPKEEIDFLMSLPTAFEEDFKETFETEQIRVRFSGRRDRISEKNREYMQEIEDKTKDREGLVLNICFDYGGRYEITQAARKIAEACMEGALKPEDIDESTVESRLYTTGLPPVDLLIRTSGEQRTSNFLPWQLAYAEFYFTKTHWPAFKERALHRALRSFQKRNRKFGGLKGA